MKLIDFGVARLKEIARPTQSDRTHHLIGSMGYMAPEQFQYAKGVGFRPISTRLASSSSAACRAASPS